MRIGWAGADGVGYLKSVLKNRAGSFVRDDLVLITSGLERDVYTNKERYQFAIAVLKLAQSQPDYHFVWRPRPEELSHVDAASVIDFVEEYGATNLHVEKAESIRELVQRCHVGVVMPSSSLLEFEAGAKPVLVYQCPRSEGIVSPLCGFRNAFDLVDRWPQLLADPASFRVAVGMSPLDPARLRERVEGGLRGWEPPSHWFSLALQCIALLRDGQATRGELEKLSSAVAQVSRRVGTVEKTVSTIDRNLTKVPPRLTKLLERVGVLQRSTLAYKALRLVSGRRLRENESGKE